MLTETFHIRVVLRGSRMWLWRCCDEKCKFEILFHFYEFECELGWPHVAMATGLHGSGYALSIVNMLYVLTLRKDSSRIRSACVLGVVPVPACAPQCGPCACLRPSVWSPCLPAPLSAVPVPACAPRCGPCACHMLFALMFLT